MATVIDDIEQNISSISPLMKTSEVINIPADEDAFVSAYEANNDDLVDLATELQTFRTQLNTSIGQINTANSETESNALIASAVGNYQGVWSSGTTYSKSMGVSVGGLYYISKVDNNLNHAVTDTNYWTPSPANFKINTDLTGYTDKVTPIDADLIPLSDSVSSFGLKKLSWANLKATLKTYFDTLYNFYNPNPTIATGTATFTATTNNINLTGIGIGVEIGDVIQISGAEDTKNNSEFTIEVITDNNNIIVNQAHANKGTSKNVAARSGDTGVTVKLLAKWYNASDGLGQDWVDVSSSRVKNTMYPNNTNRKIEISAVLIPPNTGSAVYIEVNGNNVSSSFMASIIANTSIFTTAGKGANYKLTGTDTNITIVTVSERR